jgi:hypothetical protein
VRRRGGSGGAKEARVERVKKALQAKRVLEQGGADVQSKRVEAHNTVVGQVRQAAKAEEDGAKKEAKDEALMAAMKAADRKELEAAEEAVHEAVRKSVLEEAAKKAAVVEEAEIRMAKVNAGMQGADDDSEGYFTTEEDGGECGNDKSSDEELEEKTDDDTDDEMLGPSWRNPLAAPLAHVTSGGASGPTRLAVGKASERASRGQLSESQMSQRRRRFYAALSLLEDKTDETRGHGASDRPSEISSLVQPGVRSVRPTARDVAKSRRASIEDED